MSEFNPPTTVPVSRVKWRLRVTVTGLVSRAVGRWDRRRAAVVLHRLDDSQLEDIGISRNEISRVAARLVP